MADTTAILLDLKKIWLVSKENRQRDGARVARLDEQLHSGLVSAAGNAEMTRIHTDLTEKIRIMRRLDFTKANRIEATYQEHGKLLQLLLRKKLTEASVLLRSHIQESKIEVRKITLNHLYEAQSLNRA